MDSYPSRATVVDVPAFRAFNRSKQVVLGGACRVTQGKA